MYALFFDGVNSLYQQAALGIKLYNDLLRINTQFSIHSILSGDTLGTADSIQILPKEDPRKDLYNHQIIYYDFLHHCSVSREHWQKRIQDDFNHHYRDISEKLLSTSEEIRETVEKLHKQFSRFTYTYTSQIINPLFQSIHYKQYRNKHIGVQGKKDNIVFAFTFSPKEMSLYQNIESLNRSWENEKESIQCGFTDTLGLIKELILEYEKIRILDGFKDSRDLHGENWIKQTQSEIMSFICMLDWFEPENYLNIEREILMKTYSEAKETIRK